MKWPLFLLAILISSCGEGGEDQTSRLDERAPLIVAAQSVSLEFPLHFGVGDDPPGYVKVAPADEQGDTREHLIDALVLCSHDLAWIEKTSHTMAVMMPSEENAIWKESTGWRPSDQETIDCIKRSAKQPFFYRKVPKGTETYSQN
jgi:hypothetical protein